MRNRNPKQIYHNLYKEDVSIRITNEFKKKKGGVGWVIYLEPSVKGMWKRYDVIERLISKKAIDSH